MYHEDWCSISESLIILSGLFAIRRGNNATGQGAREINKKW